MIGSQKYQLLIQDIKTINAKIKLTRDGAELGQLKLQLSELLQIKSMYTNIDSTIEAIKLI